ncbi:MULTISPECIES: hypothetical protein [unclassified Aureispira]|uniref:hypothetical protein n=1 Tax=unclassified Aureispira TaxID=2649989 RepID=UPI00069869D1|nr:MULTISPECIES: hypothetical protein [unclassified Aureispira]WMX14024.1 hypothetical protein QP953_24525 [Aureispira sp. CCB-E]
MEHYWWSKWMLILFLTISFGACKGILSKRKMEEQLKNLERFTYEFTDSSVPPPFHRSYTIDANKDSIRLTVDSYGDTLAQKEYPMPENGFERIGVALLKHKINRRLKEKQSKGCTGGTTESISWSAKNEANAFDAFVYHCGSKDYGTLVGDVDSFLVDIQFLTPDLEEVIQTTR